MLSEFVNWMYAPETYHDIVIVFALAIIGMLGWLVTWKD
jgi:hypothetical protein